MLFSLAVEQVILAGMMRRLEPDSRAVSPSGQGARAADSYDMPRACALFDMPYIAHYVRGADGLFRLAGVAKISSAEARPGAGHGSTKTPALPFNWHKIAKDSDPERCPWCGAKGLILCHACETVVCEGKTKQRGAKKLFDCRQSCGNVGEVEGFFHESPCTEGPRERKPPQASPLRSGSATAPPANHRPLLSE